MPQDKNGVEIKIGDFISVTCKIKAFHITENGCDLTLEVMQNNPDKNVTIYLYSGEVSKF